MSHKEYLYGKVRELRKKATKQWLEVKKHIFEFNKLKTDLKKKKQAIYAFKELPLIDWVFLIMFKGDVDKNTKTCEILLPDMENAIKFFDLVLKHKGLYNFLDKLEKIKFNVSNYDYYNRENIEDDGIDYVIAIGQYFKIKALYRNGKSPLSLYTSYDALEKILKTKPEDI